MEEEIRANCHRLGCELLKEALETYDAELAENRDRSVYRHKGKRKSVIKTVMGEVEYKRAVYEVTAEGGRKCCVYLLDEAMGREGIGFISSLLSEEIVWSACGGSYREAAREVSEKTGQRISHQAVWTVAQKAGESVDEQERSMAAQAAEHRGRGKIEAPVLFEEQDGIWLKLQGKSRKQHGVSHEMKLAIAYDGAKKKGKKHYELTNKVACANFEPAGTFAKRKEGVIAGTYNLDEIEMRFLNGDGAAWIKQSVTDETVHFQLDLFHRNKAVRQWVKEPEKQRTIFQLLYARDIELLLTYIEGLSNSVDFATEEGQRERENLLSLLSYFTNNRDALVPYHQRGLDIPKPPEGIEYRRMGCMESNIFTILGRRMKGGRACWSVGGGNNIARLLCLKATGKLSETLKSLPSVVLPEKYAEEGVSVLTSAKVAKHIGQGYNGHHQATAPATSDFKWLRGFGALRPLTEI